MSPKKRNEYYNTFEQYIQPRVQKIVTDAMAGKSKFNRDKVDALIDWINGPMGDQILFGSCKNCGHTPARHRDEDAKTMKPCDHKACTCEQYAASADKNSPVYAKISLAFTGFSKMIQAGIDDASISMIVGAVDSLGDASDDFIVWIQKDD